MGEPHLRRTIRTGVAAGSLPLLLLASVPAQARTCTIDLDDLKQVREEITHLLRDNVHVQSGRWKVLRRKYLEGLDSGDVRLDLKDLKGAVSGRGRPSKALVE